MNCACVCYLIIENRVILSEKKVDQYVCIFKVNNYSSKINQNCSTTLTFMTEYFGETILRPQRMVI